MITQLMGSLEPLKKNKKHCVCTWCSEVKTYSVDKCEYLNNN